MAMEILTKWCFCHGDTKQVHYFVGASALPLCGKKLLRARPIRIFQWKQSGDTAPPCPDCTKKHTQMWRDNVMPL